jgi:hypothetical protein
MNGLATLQAGGFGPVPGNWTIADTGDFDGNGTSDILWRDANSGTVAIWFLDGLAPPAVQTVGAITTDWTIQGTNAD